MPPGYLLVVVYLPVSSSSAIKDLAITCTRKVLYESTYQFGRTSSFYETLEPMPLVVVYGAMARNEAHAIATALPCALQSTALPMFDKPGSQSIQRQKQRQDGCVRMHRKGMDSGGATLPLF